MDYESMTKEQLIAEVLKQKDIKQEVVSKRDELKLSNAELFKQLEELKESQESLKTAFEEKQKAEQLKVFEGHLSNLKVQDKFKEDLINKANLTLDMDEKAINIAVSEVLEAFPEFKQPVEQVKLDPEETKDNDILDQMRRYI